MLEELPMGERACEFIHYFIVFSNKIKSMFTNKNQKYEKNELR